MTRLIDADALIDKYQRECTIDVFRYEVLDDLNNAPTIDAAPVIRCKDCKHYYALNEVRGNCSEYNFIEKIPIDYCSWAERKDNGADKRRR